MQRPRFLLERPQMPYDPLSQWLSLLAVRCTLSGSLQASGEWSVTIETTTPKINVITHGETWLLHDDLGGPIKLHGGDAFMLTRPGTYVLCSHPSLKPVHASEVFSDSSGVITGTPGPKAGPQCHMVGCAVTLDTLDVQLLISRLPTALVVPGAQSSADAIRWLIMRLRDELDSLAPGTNASQELLARMLCVEFMRYWARHSSRYGLLTALIDNRLAACLHAVHNDPGRQWKVEDLAKLVAMSRSAFAARFKALTGLAPLEYIMRWRMRLAAHALREGTQPISRIAESIGYQSDSAFSLAFKRIYGMAPSSYRRNLAVGE
ncbi:helix-turn-helix transcriptional regulator [Achromobacter dolens]|uniref:helix-turn-helix transcriptional regulator n=1 Tax=Achromobacter dolens TaxID=1287738 RepID=UPI00346422DA